MVLDAAKSLEWVLFGWTSGTSKSTSTPCNSTVVVLFYGATAISIIATLKSNLFACHVLHVFGGHLSEENHCVHNTVRHAEQWHNWIWTRKASSTQTDNQTDRHDLLCEVCKSHSFCRCPMDSSNGILDHAVKGLLWNTDPDSSGTWSQFQYSFKVGVMCWHGWVGV